MRQEEWAQLAVVMIVIYTFHKSSERRQIQEHNKSFVYCGWMNDHVSSPIIADQYRWQNVPFKADLESVFKHEEEEEEQCAVFLSVSFKRPLKKWFSS